MALEQRRDKNPLLCVCHTLNRCSRSCTRAAPHRALKQDRALVWHMCNKMWKQRKFGNREYRRGMVRKLPVSVGQKLTTGGRGSHLKKCCECQQPSQLSAPEIVEIGLQWEKVGLCWELNHHSQPVWGWEQPCRLWVSRDWHRELCPPPQRA